MMIHCSDICICIPVYKKEIDEVEQRSLLQCSRILNKYDKILVVPNSLDISSYEKICNFSDVQRFDDEWFISTASYSRLCLNSNFYQKFLKYKYMLIYQLDAFVFRDDLLIYANCGFDYIGAPWCHLCKSCQENVNSSKYVGNGGLSLRNVLSFFQQTKNVEQDSIHENEDLFLKRLNLKFPSCQIAMRFSVESDANRLVSYCGQLPFGFHNLSKINRPLYDFLVNKTKRTHE